MKTPTAGAALPAPRHLCPESTLSATQTTSNSCHASHRAMNERKRNGILISIQDPGERVDTFDMIKEFMDNSDYKYKKNTVNFASRNILLCKAGWYIHLDESGQTNGLLVVLKEGDVIVSFHVYVSPRCRRRGIGATLYSVMEDHAKPFSTIISSPETEGVELHKSLGFKEAMTMHEHVKCLRTGSPLGLLLLHLTDEQVLSKLKDFTTNFMMYKGNKMDPMAFYMIAVKHGM